MAISDTITSMYANTSNAYDMLSNGTDLTGINKNLENLSSTIFEAFLEALRNPDTLFTNLPKTSGSGSQITLNGTAYSPMRITLGSSALEQTTYTGKNLLNIYNFDNIDNASEKITITNETIVLSNVASVNGYAETGKKLSDICPNLQVGDVVYLFFNTTSSAGNKYKIYLTTPSSIAWNDGASKTITQNMLDAKIVLYGGYNETAIISNFMITKTNNREYEPYVGGTASPNPSYPQDIHTISGSNSIVVEGKNLISSVAKNGNRLFFNGANETDYQFKAGTYTFSFTKNISGNIGVFLRTASTSNSNIGGTSPITFTSNEDFNVWLYRSGITLEEVSEIQLEKGSTATTYTPYVSQTAPINLGEYEIGTIGDYKNRIFKNIPTDEDYSSEREEGAWYYKEGIGKVVLDGTESWTYNSGKLAFYHALKDNLRQNIASNSICKATNLTNYADTLWNDTAGNIEYGFLINNQYFYIRNIHYSVASDLQTWLSNNNVSAYYPLATPTYTKITGELANQLEQVHKGMLSYDGTTNISQVNNDLPFTLSVSAIEDLS